MRDLPQPLLRAIGGGFALIDSAWAKGQIPAWLFPFIKDLGVLTATCADASGDDLLFVERCAPGS
ncbi:hypothetical protein K2Z83_22830 [Oscillochloris sp. ZM17-4]|uniref:hypothetical protein n=1 Tax=Oscillochloris sp. ZM17-4 TaxID=2866714 RepID=UPI001C733429|nr:hypothetical protein [Oscillochloris sp. ZM17-4]MBX0330494.1 hypothetical protein [Oscillochloris sp. ZM17-4]